MEERNMWIPVTPEKPFQERPTENNLQSETRQTKTGGDWQNLLGIYTGVLQNDRMNDPIQAAFHHNSNDATPSKQTGVVNFTNTRLLTSNHDGTLVLPVHNGQPRNFSNIGSYNSIQDMSTLQKYRNSNQDILMRSGYPYNQNTMTGIRNARATHIPCLNGVPITSPHTRIEKVFTGLPQDLNLHTYYAGYQPQGMTSNSSSSVSYPRNDNSDLISRLGGATSSNAVLSSLAPVTPDAQKQYQNTASSSPQSEILEKPNELSENVPGSTIAASSTQPDEKNKSDGENEGIDLNRTPQQKTPKRKKHRPKVVAEGKQKRPPKPAKTESNTPARNSTVKRSYVHKDEIKTAEEVEITGQGEYKKSCRRSLNFDSDDKAKKPSKDAKFDYQAEKIDGSERSVNLSQIRQTTTAFDQSMSRIPNQELMQRNVLSQPSGPGDYTLNAIASNSNMQNITENHTSTSARNQVFQCTSRSLAQLLWPASTDKANLGNQRQPQFQSIPQKQKFSEVSDIQGLQRHYANNEKSPPKTTTLMGCTLLDGSQGTSYSNSGIANDEYSEQTQRQMKNNLLSASFLRCNNVLDPNNRSSKVMPDFRKLQQQEYFSTQQMNQKILQQTAIVQKSNPLSEVTRWNHVYVSKRGTKHMPIEDSIALPDSVAVKKRTSGKTASKKVSIIDKIHRQDSTNDISYGNSSKKGSRKKGSSSIDDLVSHLKDLQMTNSDQRDQSALVPYRAQCDIVPYGEFDPVKRRCPRPKVDLDPETTRLWNLLMGKEESENAETMDTDKQKWWEEERRVFRGRVDSFIARMHLVQGDRRFSKWKGSVVDSVIGVFLTQNVSDHLSSSAFMCLAAKFPMKPKNVGQSWQDTGEKSLADCNGTHKITGYLAYDHISVTTAELSECKEAHGFMRKEAFSTKINSHTLRTEDDVISSQSSSGSFIFQASEDIRSSSSESISEAEEGCNISGNLVYQGLSEQSQQCRIQPMGSFLPNKKPVIQSADYRPQMTTGLEKWEADFLASSWKQNLSSLASENFEFTNGSGTNGSNINKVLYLEGTCRTPKNRILELQQSKLNHEIHGNLEMQTNTQENWKKTGSVTHEPDSMGHPTEDRQIYTFNKLSKRSKSAISNTTNQKTEKGKADTSNWDNLRKQAKSRIGKKERCLEAADSLDYEALRSATVGEISEIIKERGMNNLLAERIKDFLDRVVQDHESVDLEWLRDVPPDKVKDYLLSIRGLGLKSVECVRLLTLHHLAFPVDTNVGRIAVRLGWVPLQPLPESLQLHLLELYPVLESIQKYLWPRLCKLDQETLYELHYQMITFGKVFCTKRDPNCNACPMRGECRHFASAFASARLALPGTEEKRVISSVHPIGTYRNTDSMTKPMLLPSSLDNIQQEMSMPKTCEPVIEEPTTPELPVAVTVQDIEDAFYEDPDEIPVIELNVKEFTRNLQSYIQKNVEIEEVDMSKALVALNPGFASLPAPKLKNVSRLRTEHQVYELPDTHPLLEGMDKREADDPSPYLLAIWTPGETADSVQPPENKCSFQEQGNMCYDKTCFSCSSIREAQALTVRGTILIPCRTAMRGSFPLNGTYFQVNEVFADHESSLNPIDVPRSFIWNLPRRTVFFGTTVATIFKGLPTEDIQYCFWKGFVCVRGFDQKSRAPRPLMARLHLPATKMGKRKE